MFKIVQISSLFYGVISEDDGSFRIVSEGFSTREMAESMLKANSLFLD